MLRTPRLPRRGLLLRRTYRILLRRPWSRLASSARASSPCSLPSRRRGAAGASRLFSLPGGALKGEEEEGASNSNYVLSLIHAFFCNMFKHNLRIMILPREPQPRSARRCSVPPSSFPTVCCVPLRARATVSPLSFSATAAFGVRAQCKRHLKVCNRLACCTRPPWVQEVRRRLACCARPPWVHEVCRRLACCTRPPKGARGV